MTATNEAALLRADSVAKSFRGVAALSGASLQVAEGEILGIIGPNGAGKTTLFNVIAGVFRPTSGRVVFRGRDITSLPPHRRLRLGIARTFQLIKPFASLSVYENIVVGASGRGRWTRSLPGSMPTSQLISQPSWPPCPIRGTPY
jgi:branched-chain amino acid transport system ATP-binding protein